MRVAHLLAGVMLSQCAVGVLPHLASANWPGDGLPISTADSGQVLRLALEIPRWQDFGYSQRRRPSALFMVWEDHRAEGALGSDLYFQAVEEGPVTWWPAGGEPLAAGPGIQSKPVAALFGTWDSFDLHWGGVAIAYLDQPPVGPTRIGVTSFVAASSSGGPGCPAFEIAYIPSGSIDGSVALAGSHAGMIVGWVNAAEPRIHLQRLNDCRSPQWGPNGIAVGPAVGAQSAMSLIRDGEGGVYVSWLQATPATSDTTFDLRLQHLDQSGSPKSGWPAGGSVVASAGTDVPTLALRYLGGRMPDGYVYWNISPVVVWQELASGDLFARTLAWPPGSLGPTVPLVVAPGLQTFKGADVDPISTRLFVMFEDDREGAGQDVYAQSYQWNDDPPTWGLVGKRVIGGTGDQTASSIVALPGGGAMVAWTDLASGSAAPYAKRLTSAGETALDWPSGGALLCSAPGEQREPLLVSNYYDGALAVWTDSRNLATTGTDIYAQTVSGSGDLTLGVPAAAGVPIQIGAAHPNPARNEVRFDLTLSEEANIAADIYDVAGRHVARIDRGIHPRGSLRLEWNGRNRSGLPATSGIHFLRVAVGGKVLTRRFVLVR